MHLSAALKTHVAFGPCSIQTELLQTTLSAKHLSAAGANGLVNVLSHNLPRTQSQMTQLVAVVIGEVMTQPQRLSPLIARVQMKLPTAL
jgi:hypothetical protein